MELCMNCVLSAHEQHAEVSSYSYQLENDVY